MQTIKEDERRKERWMKRGKRKGRTEAWAVKRATKKAKAGKILDQ